MCPLCHFIVGFPCMREPQQEHEGCAEVSVGEWGLTEEGRRTDRVGKELAAIGMASKGFAEQRSLSSKKKAPLEVYHWYSLEVKGPTKRHHKKAEISYIGRVH